MTSKTNRGEGVTYLAEGLNHREACDLYDRVVQAFGCRENGSQGRQTRSILERAHELAQGEDLALRNAARVVLSPRRRPWESLVLADRILRRYGAPS